MKKTKKWIIASLCVGLAGVCAAPVGMIVSKAVNSQPTWTEIDLASEYVVDDTIAIPERTLSVGGSEYQTDIKLCYPSGVTVKMESGEFSFAEAGAYTLIYEAKDANSKYYKEEVDLFVADKLWRVGSEKSSFEYGTVGNTSALLVSLAKNDTLTFNKIIDVSELTSADTLIKGFINPTTIGTYEFDKIKFTFTDVYDPTQTLTIQGSRSTSTDQQRCTSYWTAAGTNQTLGGWDANTNGGTGGFVNNVHFGIRGTAATSTSFYSQWGDWSKKPLVFSDVPADQVGFTLSFDPNDMKVSVVGRFVADLNEAAYYEKEPLWNGFPSGKVRLTVEALDYAGETANFAISQLYGYEEGFGVKNKFVETDAPNITVDVDEKYVVEQNGRYSFAPLAVVGANYPVPAATAFDEYSGTLSVKKQVYYNYSSEKSRVEYPIVNNTFNVDMPGSYAIVYTAKDNMGNTAESVYWITAKSSLENPLTLTVNTAGAKTSGLCGERIAVAPVETAGGSGDVSVAITASCGDTVLTVEGGKFIPEQAGKWTVKYVATDFAGSSKESTYEITVEWGDKPVFVDAPILPKYLVAGIEYDVPSVIAYDYTSGKKVEKVASLKVKDASGEKVYEVGETFIPNATEEKNVVTLEFVAGAATYSVEIPAVMPIIEVEDGGELYTEVHIEKMFLVDNASVERTKDGMFLTAEEAGDIDWFFANAVAAEAAAVNVRGVQGKSNFDAFQVTFTDYENSNIAVTMNVECNEKGFAVVNFGSINRETTKGFNLGKDANGNNLDAFSFSYKFGQFYVDELAVTVSVDDNGNPFKGFPSNKVYISAKAVNAKAEATYVVEKIDNHLINQLTNDMIAPKVAINGSYGGMYKVNSTYTVTTALATDVIDANVTCSVTVRTPNGQIVTDENGLELNKVPATQEYVIQLVEYGQYMVEYNTVDWNNRRGSTSYSVNVFDRKAPRVKVADTWSATAKVGETVALPEVYIADDASEVAEMQVYRTVRNPNGILIQLGYDFVVENGQLKYIQYKYTFQYAGEYVFNIIVYDATGNQTLVNYVVTVE